MAVTRKYLPWILITFLFPGMINSIGDKQIKCQRALDYITEKTKMACLSEEVIYVKKQAITSHISSLAGSEKSCAFNLVKGAYTQFLPLNDSISNSTPFIAGISCNLKSTCDLNKDLLYKTFDLFHISCNEETTYNWTKDSIFTSFTYLCIPKNRLFDFSGNNWKTTKTFRDVHLVTNSFYGNFTCEVYGTIHLLSLLEVSGASLNLYGDDEKLYNNDNRNVYGTDITYSGLNANHTNHTRYIFKIYTEWKGRVWIHLKGHLIINCSKISELHTLTTVDTDKNLTKINTSTNIVHSKDLKSQTRLFLLLLLIGVVVALTLMAGVHILQRRKDKQKLYELSIPTDRISINFTEHVSETSVDRATEEGNIYSEISSSRGHLLCFGNGTQDIN